MMMMMMMMMMIMMNTLRWRLILDSVYHPQPYGWCYSVSVSGSDTYPGEGGLVRRGHLREFVQVAGTYGSR
jgi:hypothetical protein